MEDISSRKGENIRLVGWLLIWLVGISMVGALCGHFVHSSFVFGILVGAWLMLQFVLHIMDAYWDIRFKTGVWGLVFLVAMGISRALT